MVTAVRALDKASRSGAPRAGLRPWAWPGPARRPSTRCGCCPAGTPAHQLPGGDRQALGRRRALPGRRCGTRSRGSGAGTRPRSL